MPVKFGMNDSVCSVLPSDMENLVRAVKDRLCLKTKERLHSLRTAPYSTKRMAGNWQAGRALANCRYCSASSRVCSGKCSHRIWANMCRGQRDSDSDSDNAHVLLQRLLEEQTLIQEAVRRLQTRGVASVEEEDEVEEEEEEEDEEDGDHWSEGESDFGSFCRTPVRISRPQRSRNISESHGGELPDDIIINFGVVD